MSDLNRKRLVFGVSSGFWQGLGRSLLALAAGLLLFKGLAYHWLVASFPYQVSPLEGGILQSARALAAGADPWSLDLAPQFFNTYGLVYPGLGALLAPWVPGLRWLFLLRLLSALGVALAAWIFYRGLRSAGAGRGAAALASLCLYLGFICYDTVVVRPDTWAMVFYVSCLALGLHPGRHAGRWAGLAAGLAFFTKPYAVLGAPLAALMFWVQGRRRQAVETVLCAAAALLGFGLLVWWRHPHYYEGTALIFMNGRDVSWAWLLEQAWLFAQMQAPLLLGLLLGAAWIWRQGGAWKPSGPALAALAATALAALALAAGPGAHKGAFMIYFCQLLAPPLLAAGVLLSRQWQAPSLAAALLALNAASIAAVNNRYFSYVPRAQDQGWPEAAALVRQRPYGIYPPCLTSVAVDEGAFITDTDHTHVLMWSNWRGRPFSLARAASQHWQKVSDEAAAGRFQAVVCGTYWACPEGWPNAKYRAAGKLCLQHPIRFGEAPCFLVYLPKEPVGPPPGYPRPQAHPLQPRGTL